MTAAPVPLPGEEGRGRAVRAMFDRIAPGYDLLNRVMTFQVDRWWRRRLVRGLALQPGERLLDLCAGTMDVAAEARRQAPGVRVVGVDFSREMLARGAAKTGIPAAQGDALALPFGDATFDAATVAFGVRNLESLARGLAELARVLKPGARLGVLELFRATTSGARLMHGAYNRVALPVLGRALSPDPQAYRYLVASMERFTSLPEFVEACRTAGFDAVRGGALFPGVCGLVLARRAVSPAAAAGERRPEV